MAITDFDAGYLQALNDVREEIKNATDNGYSQHYDYELQDQIIMLADQRGLSLPEL